MQRKRRVLRGWLPLAAVATALCLLVYVAAQQLLRQSANDPQIQIAMDATVALEGGQPAASVLPAPIDIAQSLAPFVVVVSDAGVIEASSGMLQRHPVSVPAGVLDYVREHGEERVTWQPEPGVRIAAVVVRRPGERAGFVAAGRSLRETERRVVRFGSIVGLVWMAILAGSLIVVAAGEYVFHPQ